MNNRFIILAFIFLISTFYVQKSWSQRDPLNKRITIKTDKQSVEKILGEISNRGKIYFSYNSDILPLDSIVSVNFERKEIYKILDYLLQNKFYYKTTGQHVIILKKKGTSSTQKEKIKIQGRIIEFGTGFRIENASIYDIAGKEVALSNANGYFLISVLPKEDYVGLAINKSNYQDTIVFVKTNEDKTIDIALRPVFIAVASIAPKIDYTPTTANVEQSALVSKFVKKDMIFHANNIAYFKKKLGQISLLPYAGTNYKFSGSIVNNISLNLLSGYSYGTNGLELGGLLNINRKKLNGAQLAGFGNITGDKTNGLQIAGFFNHSFGKVRGVQIAGFHNMILDSIDGIQISGFANILKGKIRGAQISGFANITTEEVVASQISGFANVALKDSKGIQLSGFANIANGNQGGIQASGYGNFVKGTMKGVELAGFINISKNVIGLQAAGFSNISTKEVKGVQISGFLNYAKNVKGCQIGIINIADTVSGGTIGIFNFVRKGLHEISIGINESGGADINLSLGSYRFYTIFGYAQLLSDIDTRGITFGFGSKFFATRRLNFNLNVTATGLINDSVWDFEKGSQISKIAADVNFRLTKHFSIFAGASFNVLRYNANKTEFNDYPKNYLFPTTFQETVDGMVFKGWAGASFGLKFRF